MTARRVVVVDCETSALAPRDANGAMFGLPSGVHGVAVEIAWHDLDSDESGRFVPQHSTTLVRSHGSPEALVVSRYLERLVNAPQDDGAEVRALHERLVGATLAGSNPAFDARFLRPLFARYGCDPIEPWHHRLLDLAAFAAGKLGIEPGAMPGLATVCEHLDVDAPDHTAAGDVRATVECLGKLIVLRPAFSDGPLP